MKMKLALAIGIMIGLIGGLAVGYIVTIQITGVDKAVLEQQISQLEEQVSAFESQVQEKDSQISNLTSQIAELEQLLPPLTKGEWNKITKFMGATSKTTELFHIPNETWRIIWGYVGESSAVFSFFVYPEGETESYVESLSTTGANQMDETYIYVGQENFYIKLIAANIDHWSLAVETFVPP